MLLSAMAVLFAGASCKSEAPDRKPESDAETQPERLPKLPEPKMIPSQDRAPIPRPNLAVELPPPPIDRLEGPKVPAKYDDGGYSIAGLRADLDTHIDLGEAGTTIEVRAFVQEIIVPTCVGSDGCGQPHFWVTDAPDVVGRRLALLVGPYEFDLSDEEARYFASEPKIFVEVGKQYLFKGNFVRMSDTGFSSPRGVLQFHAVQTEAGEWVYPPGSPWHPKTEILRAQQKAELMDKVGR